MLTDQNSPYQMQRVQLEEVIDSKLKEFSGSRPQTVYINGYDPRVCKVLKGEYELAGWTVAYKEGETLIFS